MSCLYIFAFSVLVTTSAGPVTESYKDQYCTDPRTMQKHAAYTEWADAYSCTRHRCQPGGRNLAIYTVGCKRVEAPESAIECEEVVEDTNMQFPFCCTRLRCLVVVRGEVWTRVLGQPWETLPAAPWSHMYKMKKPPPPNGTLLSQSPGAGPVYELADAAADDQKVLRTSKKATAAPDCNDKPVHVPDIVIALATEPENKEQKKSDNRHKRRKTSHQLSEEAPEKEPRTNDVEFEDAIVTERSEASEEKANLVAVTRKSSKSHQAAWTEIPQKEWNEQEPSSDTENSYKDPPAHEAEEDKKPALQALVDAIGSRMRDIENVVHKMSEKVQHTPDADSLEKRLAEHQADSEALGPRHHKAQPAEHGAVMKPKQPAPDNDHYKRFTIRSRGSKYLRSPGGAGGVGGPSEPPLLVEDAHLDGYFSDASNSVRRVNPPKEPAQYVAPVETHHKTHILSDGSDETRKHRRSHKKKGKGHKKHHSKDKRKKLRQNSAEIDRNVVSLEENSAIVAI